MGTSASGRGIPAGSSVQTLAYTGASHTVLMITVAVLVIFAGLLLNGLSRRYVGLAAARPQGSVPPLRS
ncbi:MAG: hypothetical protein ABIV94_02685 [Acidimicrobiales bacterium]